MIANRKRLLKIENAIKKKYAYSSYSKFIIKAKDGLYLVDLHKWSNRYTKIDSLIDGYLVEDLQEFTMEHILVCGDGSYEPIFIIDDFEDDIGGLNSNVIKTTNNSL